MPPQIPAAIVIFGASGDLTRRKLVPALHSLDCEGLLSPVTRVVGVARTPLSDDEFRAQLGDGVRAYARLKPDVCNLWPRAAASYSYLAGGYDDPDTYRRLGNVLERFAAEEGTAGNVLFYLAVPPALYETIVEHLGQSGLNRSAQGWRRIVIEKPFGHDLASARALSARVHAAFHESQVYRIDHYLGKETVQNLLTLRFANAIFEPLWNRNYIDHVQITVAESGGVGERAGYYDKVGVVRDMFQNHLLQLLTLMAMEPPATLGAAALHDEKMKVLHALRPAPRSVCGQYAGYRQEKGVAADSHTATYAALAFYVDNWRWRDVAFYLRSGKALAAKQSEINMQFKHVPHLLFPLPAGQDIAPNVLSLCLQPDEGIRLRFQVKEPGAGMQPRSAQLRFHYAETFGPAALPDAYERLLLDALQGDQALFSRADVVEMSWRVVDPVVAAWEQPGAPPPFIYQPGTWGPPEADVLLSGDDRAWLCESL